MSQNDEQWRAAMLDWSAIDSSTHRLDVLKRIMRNPTCVLKLAANSEYAISIALGMNATFRDTLIRELESLDRSEDKSSRFIAKWFLLELNADSPGDFSEVTKYLIELDLNSEAIVRLLRDHIFHHSLSSKPFDMALLFRTLVDCAIESHTDSYFLFESDFLITIANQLSDEILEYRFKEMIALLDDQRAPNRSHGLIEILKVVSSRTRTPAFYESLETLSQIAAIARKNAKARAEFEVVLAHLSNPSSPKIGLSFQDFVSICFLAERNHYRSEWLQAAFSDSLDALSTDEIDFYFASNLDAVNSNSCDSVRVFLICSLSKRLNPLQSRTLWEKLFILLTVQDNDASPLLLKSDTVKKLVFNFRNEVDPADWLDWCHLIQSSSSERVSSFLGESISTFGDFVDEETFMRGVKLLINECDFDAPQSVDVSDELYFMISRSITRLSMENRSWLWEIACGSSQPLDSRNLRLRLELVDDLAAVIPKELFIRSWAKQWTETENPGKELDIGHEVLERMACGLSGGLRDEVIKATLAKIETIWGQDLANEFDNAKLRFSLALVFKLVQNGGGNEISLQLPFLSRCTEKLGNDECSEHVFDLLTSYAKSNLSADHANDLFALTVERLEWIAMGKLGCVERNKDTEAIEDPCWEVVQHLLQKHGTHLDCDRFGFLVELMIATNGIGTLPEEVSDELAATFPKVFVSNRDSLALRLMISAFESSLRHGNRNRSLDFVQSLEDVDSVVRLLDHPGCGRVAEECLLDRLCVLMRRKESSVPRFASKFDAYTFLSAFPP